MKSKLSRSDIEYIKANYKLKSNRQLAEKFRVTKKVIHQILNQHSLVRSKKDEISLKSVQAIDLNRVDEEIPLESFHQGRPKFHAAVFIFLFVVAFTIYADSFSNKFVWDDEILVVKNNYIKTTFHIPDYFTENLFKGGDRDSNFWRPTQLFTFLWDYSIWGLNPFGFHLSNTLFHALSAFLIYFYLFLLFRKQVVAFIASLIWVIHPLQTEAVTYIAGRADSIATLFIFLTLVLYLRYTQDPDTKSPILYLGSFLAFILALMSKEMAVMTPFYMMLSDFFTRNRQVRRLRNLILRYLPFIIVFLLYCWARKTILDFANIPLLKEQAALQIPTVLRLLTFCVTVTRYLILMFFPFKLHMERGTPYASNFPLTTMLWPYIIVFIIIILLAVAAIYHLRQNNLQAKSMIDKGIQFSRIFIVIILLYNIRMEILLTPQMSYWTYCLSFTCVLLIFLNIIFLYRNHKEKCFGLTFFFLAIIPFSDVIPLNSNMLEHWLYIPSIGIFFIFVDYICQKLHFSSRMNFMETLTRITFSALIIPLILLSARSIFRNIDWKDDFTIWRETAAFSNSSHIHGNLGVAYGRKGDFKKSKEEFIKALRLQFNYPEAHNNLGVIMLMEGKLDDSIREFEFAIQFNPNYSNAYKNLGDAYVKQNKIEEAKEMWQKAVEINPYHNGARERLKQFAKQ